MRRLWPLPALIIFAVYACFHRTGSFGFIDPFEVMYAGAEMNNLYSCLTAGAFFVFGKNEFAGRIIQVLSGIAGAFLTYLSAKYLTCFNRKASHIAAFITLTSPLYFTVLRLCVPDMIFTFAFTLAIFGYIYHTQYYNKSGIIIFYAGMGLATLGGGFLRGTAAPLLVVISHIFILKRRWNLKLGDLNNLNNNNFNLPKFADLISAPGLIIYILIVSPLFLKILTVNNNIYFPGILADTLPYNGILIYAAMILMFMFPWCVFAYWAFKSLYGNFTIVREDAMLAGIWALMAFIAGFPNISACVPPLAILISSAIIEQVIEYPVRSIFRPLTFCFMCILSVVILIYDISFIEDMAQISSHRDIAAMALDYLKYESGTRIMSYGRPMTGLEFYLKRDVELIGEPDYDNKNNKNPEKTRDEKRRIRRIWNGDRQAILITRKSDAAAFQKVIGREPVKVGESAGDVLFTNY